jgi:hypothetical protein
MPDQSLPLAITPGKRPLSTDRRRLPRVRRILRDSRELLCIVPRLQRDLMREESPLSEIMRVLGNTLTQELFRVEAEMLRELELNRVGARRPYNRKKPRPVPAPIVLADTPLPLDQAA